MSLASDEVSSPTQPSSAGATLANERARQNIEAEDVCARLRISLTQVQALENDAYAKLPGPTFIRGIIRSYAKLLQIDPQPLLSAYERSATVPGTSTIEVPTQNIRFTPGSNGQPRNMRVGLLVLALVVIGGGAWLWYTNPNLAVLGLVPSASTPTAGADRAAPQASPAPTTQTAPTMNPPATGPDAQPGSSAAGAADATNAAFPPPAAGAIQEMTAQTAAGKASEPAATSGTEAPLRFAFEQDSWVEVRDRSGKVILSQLNQKGSETDVDGQPPFKIIIGNAAGVRLTYKGQSVDLAPRTKVNVARLTLE
jgi:cytoskeleton protein RodZ